MTRKAEALLRTPDEGPGHDRRDDRRDERVREVSLFDRHFPPAGPCALCGGTDKRHRLVDALRGMVAAGDEMREVAHDMDLPLEAVLVAVLAPAPWERRAR